MRSQVVQIEEYEKDQRLHFVHRKYFDKCILKSSSYDLKFSWFRKVKRRAMADSVIPDIQCICRSASDQSLQVINWKLKYVLIKRSHDKTCFKPKLDESVEVSQVFVMNNGQ